MRFPHGPIIPFWKKALSYFTEVHLESAPSDINPHLYVSLKNGRHQLSTAHAVYSYDDLYDNFYAAFEHIHIKDRKFNDVLILGFGLGSIPFMLENKFDVHLDYTAVEIDENVVYLANKYIVPGLKSNLELFIADAYSFMMQNERLWDLVCVDIFLDDKVPPQFETEEFLYAIKKAIRPNGKLLYNRLSSMACDLEETVNFFEGTFKSVFPKGENYDTGGNWILIG